MNIRLLIKFAILLTLSPLLKANKDGQFTVAAGKIVKLEHKKIQITYGMFPGFKMLLSLGSPHTIVLNNTSDKEVIIAPSVIGNEILSSNQVKEISENNTKTLVRIMMGCEIFIGALLSSTQDSKIFKAITLGLAGATSYGTHKLFSFITQKGDNARKKMMLEEPIVLKSGEIIQKIFWLKNPEKFIKINFNAIIE